MRSSALQRSGSHLFGSLLPRLSGFSIHQIICNSVTQGRGADDHRITPGHHINSAFRVISFPPAMATSPNHSETDLETFIDRHHPNRFHRDRGKYVVFVTCKQSLLLFLKPTINISFQIYDRKLHTDSDIKIAIKPVRLLRGHGRYPRVSRRRRKRYRRVRASVGKR